MAQITLTIPDNKIQLVLDAFDTVYERPYTLSGEKPPFTKTYTITKQAWARERVRQFIIDTAQEYQRRQAIAAAEQATNKDDTLAS